MDNFEKTRISLLLLFENVHLIQPLVFISFFFIVSTCDTHLDVYASLMITIFTLLIRHLCSNLFLNSINFIIKPTFLFSLLIFEVCLFEAFYILKYHTITYL